MQERFELAPAQAGPRERLVEMLRDEEELVDRALLEQEPGASFSIARMSETLLISATHRANG